MHKIDIPQWAIERVTARRGRRHVFAEMVPARTALLVVDMQNAFLMDGVAHSLVPEAREIVPNINRLAAALRAAGGLVVWIQTAATDDAIAEWSVFHDEMMTPEARARRIAATRRGSIGYDLWSALDVKPGDARVEKTRYSAFIQGSSNIEAMLRSRGIDTVLVTGTVTGVCCESTARDAMMRNFRVVMVSDGNAARTDAEHNAALTSFYVTFGDVLSTDEILAGIAASPKAPRPQQVAE
jgi:ureidoacrylate peracid hydrolase